MRFFILILLSLTGLDRIRQEFEIYQRFAGEIEILATEDTREIGDVLKRTEAKRLAVRKQLDKDEHLPAKLPSLFLADEYIAPFLDYVAIERAVADQALQQNQLDEAVQSVRYVYRLAELFSESGSLPLRSTAARIRLQMLETAQSIVRHPHCRREHHQALYEILEDQINTRTTDTAIWERYREEGLLFFARLNRQNPAELLPPELLRELTSRRILAEYNKPGSQRAEYDQSVFRRVSEAIANSCSVPYFQRQPVLQRLDEELRQRRGTENEPIFSMLLLQEVSEQMQLFAQERSGIETAYVALSAALGKPLQNRMLNFLTGNQYEIRLIPDGVMCTYQGNIKPFYVPYR
ncbi:MAG: hypothetical protein FWG73_05115 [Planctomycetaceae bacterium]|nr:hypothetical protein [Planctomycetaceae bacterium]